MSQTNAKLKKIALLLLVLTSLVSVVFVAFPSLDLMISSLFANGSGHFPAQDVLALIFLRETLIKLMYGFLALALLGLVFSALLGSGRHIALRVWAYLVLVSVTGPLILVNAILKNNWGRARPYRVEEFGGDLIFSRAYAISDQCVTDCSFTSGEGAGIATIAVLLAVLFWHQTARKGWLVFGLSVLVFVGAGMRLIKGMHFFSDTTLSMLFCSMIAVFFFWLLNMESVRRSFGWANFKADLRLLAQRLKLIG